ncbi:MAG: ABC transporter permease subunit [Planctomycetes bacterium]|nr:ABC transporter permease subunit [Planctomycetota bacterium]
MVVAACSIAGVALCSLGGLRAQQPVLRIGSKSFTESAVMAELMAQTVEAHTALRVERRTNLGGTMICWRALVAGEIDLYAEYTGTAWATILGRSDPATGRWPTFFAVERACRREHDVRWLAPFGFDNTYALAMPRALAERLGVRSIGDLLPHMARLRAGFGIEFGSRADGYPGLRAAYGIEFGIVRSLEHALAYEAVAAGEIDVLDAYSTDGKLLRYDLQVLEDDRGFFPPYQAAPVVRDALLREHPEVEQALAKLAFRIDAAAAQRLNLAVEEQGVSAHDAARAFLVEQGIVGGVAQPAEGRREGLLALLAARWADLLRWLWQHVLLTGVSVVLAAAVAIPLGVVAAPRPQLRRVLLAAAGVMQTIPSLALLALLIPVLGLDVGTAIAALFLYALLPILRNTCAGLAGVGNDLIDAARGMGLLPRQVLLHVQLPLAWSTILAGVRTSTVIGVGVATLAAFVGAGGLGTPILDGLYLGDADLILLGAVPAALLAVGADVLLGWVEAALKPGPRRRS